jgi:hypothetical protein
MSKSILASWLCRDVEATICPILICRTTATDIDLIQLSLDPLLSNKQGVMGQFPDFFLLAG